MATTWERLAGDTSKFAIRLSFSDDPEPNVGSTFEESSSWGSFQIWVREKNLCAHRFAEDQFETVHWYLLPLLEWFVGNWDPLFHEERLPNLNAGASAQESLRKTAEAPILFSEGATEKWDQNWYDWWGRHCIEAARFGGVFPLIFVRRWRDRLEVSWDQAREPVGAEGVQFLPAAGAARVGLDDAASALYPVLKEAAEYLLSRNPESERLQLLRHEILRLRRHRDERLAWLLGFGASLSDMQKSLVEIKATVRSLSDVVRRAIWDRGASGGLFVEPFPAALMFGAVSPRLEPKDRMELLRLLAGSVDDQGTHRIDELAVEVPLDEHSPWEQGYELAQDCLATLDVNRDEPRPVNIEEMVANLGVQVRQIELQDRAIRGVAMAGPSYRPTVLLNQRHRANEYPSGTRFTLAHELCHLMYDRIYAREVALPSGPWAPKDVEQRANAFAAMLLMPAAQLRRLVSLMSDRREPRELVAVVSNTFQTSFTAALEHLYNLGVLTAEDREELVREAFDRFD